MMAERNCKKCFHYKACKEVASHNGYGDISYTESQCKYFISTAEVEEVKHGEWVQSKYHKRLYYCSECGRHIEDGQGKPNEYFPYCHCGAKMDGDKTE